MRAVLAMLVACSVLQAAAELPRRAYLGLQFDLGDSSGPGLLVSLVEPDSTASRAGIRAGDRLTSVGSIASLDSFAKLRDELANAVAGQPIALRWYHGNRVRRVAPQMGVLPVEEVPQSVVRYRDVAVDGLRQRLILSEPLDGAAALVVYLADRHCESQDFWFATDDPIKQLIDGWALAGLATARLEKRGVGDSEGPPCGELDLETERRGYAAVIERLLAQGWSKRLFLFGHGAGGVLAPLLSRQEIAGFMIYGTLGVPFYDHTLAAAGRRDVLAGLDKTEIAERQAARSRILQALLFEGLPAEGLSQRMRSEGLPDRLDPEAEIGYPARPARYFEQLAALDPARGWGRVWQPVLAMHGEFDWTSTRTDHERIARLTGGKFLSLSGLDHVFLRYETLSDSYHAAGGGQFDRAIIEATVNWIEAIVGNGRGSLDDADR